MKKKYAFYSTTAAQLCGTSIWRNADGTEIECTMVMNGPEPTGYDWPDVEPRGAVTDFLRSGRTGDSVSSFTRENMPTSASSASPAVDFTPRAGGRRSALFIRPIPGFGKK